MKDLLQQEELWNRRNVILGILIGMYMGLYNNSIALFFFLEVIVLILFIKLNDRKVFFIMLVIFLSFGYAKMVKYKYDNAFIVDEKFYLAQIISLKEKTQFYNKYILKIKSGKYKNYKILAYVKEDLKYGDIIKFTEKIELPEKARNDKRI